MDGADVNQPSMMWRNKDDNTTLHCNHTKGADYFQMYWYRQLPGETIKLIVFTTSVNKNYDFGKFSKDKFAADRPDVFRGTLTVNNLQPGDEGLYFCAVSKHSGTGKRGHKTKSWCLV